MQYDYSEQFIEASQIEKYVRKFTKKIDIVRHRIECQIIKRYAVGDLYDCSVGHGRFIPELTRVNTYSAMDYSEAFIQYIRDHYPQVTVNKGDLLDKIEQPDNSYDTVICMRTLSGLGKPSSIIGEMVRIAKPGGLIIFDFDWQKDISTNGLRIDTILQKKSVAIIKKARLDSPFSLTIKRRSQLSRVFNHRFNILPLFLFVLLERAWSTVSGVRALYITRKR